MCWKAHHSVFTMYESLQALFWRCWHTHKFLFVWVTWLFWWTCSQSECHQQHFANTTQKIRVLHLIICRDDGCRKVTFILKSSNFHVMMMMLMKHVYFISVCSLFFTSVYVFVYSAELLNNVMPFMKCSCQSNFYNLRISFC